MRKVIGRLLGICTTFLVVALFVSCQKGLKVRLFNRTSADVAVTPRWSHGKVEDIEIPVGKNAVFSWPLTISIRQNSNVWSYAAFPRVHTSYLEQAAFNNYLNVQVENDGTLVVRSDVKLGVVTNFGSQPPGFPLKARVVASPP